MPGLVGRMLMDQLLRRIMVMGRLTVRWPDGSISSYAGVPGPEAAFEFADWRTVWRVLRHPSLRLGEAYMDGGFRPVDRPIYDVLDTLITNVMATTKGRFFVAAHDTYGKLTRRIAQFNPAGRSRRNVAHHYDLNGRLYSLFLDRDRQYSCAYFPRGDETLEEAQIAKKRHIAGKLRLDRPDLSVLDIGCGWGGLALTLAREYGARVTGITLSTEQLNEAQARAEAEGLQDRVTFELMDYRAMHRSFDRIVSVGMFEHVGVGHYAQFFETMKRCLAADGVALLHAIGRSEAPGGDQPLDRQIHLPRRLLPGAVGGAAPDREVAADRDRHRGAAPALRGDAAPLAPPLRCQPRRDQRRSMTSGSAGCSSSIWQARNSRSAARTWWCSRSSSCATRPRCR